MKHSSQRSSSPATPPWIQTRLSTTLDDSVHQGMDQHSAPPPTRARTSEHPCPTRFLSRQASLTPRVPPLEPQCRVSLRGHGYGNSRAAGGYLLHLLEEALEALQNAQPEALGCSWKQGELHSRGRGRGRMLTSEERWCSTAMLRAASSNPERKGRCRQSPANTSACPQSAACVTGQQFHLQSLSPWHRACR